MFVNCRNFNALQLALDLHSIGCTRKHGRQEEHRGTKGEIQMTKNELSRFREILMASVAELEHLARQRDGITIERSADLLEEVQAASERALAVLHLDRGFNELRSARAALRRIHDGSFGTCQQCDEDIHPKRLAAVPWAPFCIRCQDAADHNPQETKRLTNGPLELRTKVAVCHDARIYTRKAA
jgi:DnaK suppressor protein